jgi:hypothetical protein
MQHGQYGLAAGLFSVHQLQCAQQQPTPTGRRIIQEKNRPVLLFAADTDPFVWPFLRETFKAMPANARLRELLNDFYSAMFIKADSIPADLMALGAGSKYHIAVLSPYGLTPMVTIEIQRSPEEVVRTIVEILERLVDAWR